MLNVKLIQKIVGKLDTPTKLSKFESELNELEEYSDWSDGDIRELGFTCSMIELSTLTDERELAFNIVLAIQNGDKAIISNVTDKEAAKLLKKFGFKHFMTYRGNHNKDVMCFSMDLSKYCY